MSKQQEPQTDRSDEPTGQTPDKETLEDLHESILGTDAGPATCERNDCENDADVVASAPCASVCFAICLDCLPDHVEWYELEPAEREARRVADEVASSLNPHLDYIRSTASEVVE